MGYRALGGRLAGLLLCAVGIVTAAAGGEPRDWNAACAIDVPKEPPGFRWQPCPHSPPLATSCAWLAPEHGRTPAGGVRFGRDETGEPRLAVLIEEADGEVQLAVTGPDGRTLAWLRKQGPWHESCWLRPAGLTRTHLAVDVRGDGSKPDARKSEVDALLWLDVTTGTLTAAPLVDRSQRSWGWSVGDRTLARHSAPGGGLVWIDPQAWTVVELWPHPADPSSWPAAAPAIPLEDGVLFQIGTSRGWELRVAGANGVTRPPWSPPGTDAANPGTDGATVVWTERDEATGTWIMTAPWPPAPETAVRVRRDPSPNLGANPFTVGCGLAGHTGQTPGELAVVRLHDGRLRTLPRAGVFVWDRVVGLTCDELYVTLSAPFEGVVRLPLDGLGDTSDR